MSLGVQVRWPEWQPVVLRLACEKVFRQIGTIDRRIVIGADHRHRTLVAFGAKRIRCGEAGSPATDDHDGRRMLSRVARGGPRLRLDLLPHEYHVALTFDPPARD